MNAGRSMTSYVRRYRSLPHPGTGPAAELAFDAITEPWFDDQRVFAAALDHITSTIMPDETTADELELFDRGSFRIATVVEWASARPADLADLADLAEA